MGINKTFKKFSLLVGMAIAAANLSACAEVEPVEENTITYNEDGESNVDRVIEDFDLANHYYAENLFTDDVYSPRCI